MVLGASEAAVVPQVQGYAGMIVSMMPKAPILSRDSFPGFLSRNSLQPTGGAGGGPRLIVVSNRVSVPNPRGNSAGGLAVALEAALRASGGIWFGWSGEARAAIDADALHTQQVGPVTFATTDLTSRDVDDYYLGFSNRALWPVCHYRLDLARFSETETQAYFRVNDLFARKLAGLMQPSDLVWVHDYHLIPLGEALRKRGFSNRIGFFLHIPWPPPEVVSALPGYRRLLQGLLAYDVVGFQTERDASHFLRCVRDENLVAETPEDGLITYGDRQVQVGVFPIGIDTAGIAAVAAKSVNLPATKRMTASIEGKRLLMGVDRLDYSKGLPERIRAFVAYLGMNADERGRVSYLQVTPKSRSEVPEYAELERDVATLVGEANGAYGDFDWTPIRYINQNVPHATLMGLYRMADVGLVTPLRDGMNLVAKEYVASQDPENPGVLILSRYAGAAFELSEGAVLVNPYDTMGTAAAIDQALRMSRAERRGRWLDMMGVLEKHTVNDWWQSFLDALSTPRDSANSAGGSLGATG